MNRHRIIDARPAVAALAMLALAGCASSKPATTAAPTPAPASSAPVVTTASATPSSPSPVVASSSAAVALQNFCVLAPSASLSGVFTKFGQVTATFASPICTFMSASHNSTLTVQILTGAAATAAFASPDFGPLLLTTNAGYGSWADGVKPATNGLGIIMQSGTAVCVATPVGAPSEFMPDAATRQHLLANICAPILPKFNR